MGDAPDVNGEFEVDGLSAAPGNGQWSIFKYTGEAWPNPWDWQGLSYVMKLVCDGTDEYTYPLEAWNNETIVRISNVLIYLRLQHLRGEIADTMDLYPVPPA